MFSFHFRIVNSASRIFGLVVFIHFTQYLSFVTRTQIFLVINGQLYVLAKPENQSKDNKGENLT